MKPTFIILLCALSLHALAQGGPMPPKAVPRLYRTETVTMQPSATYQQGFSYHIYTGTNGFQSILNTTNLVNVFTNVRANAPFYVAATLVDYVSGMESPFNLSTVVTNWPKQYVAQPVVLTVTASGSQTLTLTNPPLHLFWRVKGLENSDDLLHWQSETNGSGVWQLNINRQ